MIDEKNSVPDGAKPGLVSRWYKVHGVSTIPNGNTTLSIFSLKYVYSTIS